LGLACEFGFKVAKKFFSNYLNGFETSIKFCVFWILISKKLKQINFGVIEHTMSIFLNLIIQIRKKWLILLKNFFLINIVKNNNIRQLFAGEPHQGSVADPCHFGVDPEPDPDPRIHASD
jgi:hypothetical protein